MADAQQKQNPEKENPAQDDELFLVDGSGYIFRAYFALPQNLTNPDGVPVGAVLGFTNMLLKLLADMHAAHIAVIFDAARKNFRNDIYEDYKANRESAPDDLIPQFPLIREATEAFDIPAIELDGYEADDLIATYARCAAEQGRQVTIVGSDKDLMQLVTDKIRLYDPIKGRYIGPAEVEEKFGVPPEKVVDVQSLAGDSTDNVPGVPGIGIKTAAQLIHEYGDLDTLLDRAHEIKQPKRRQCLIEHAEAARISRKLVTLDAYVDVPCAVEDFNVRDQQPPKLAAFLRKQGFRSLLARLEREGGIVAQPLPEALEDTVARRDAILEALPSPAHNQYTLINDMAVLAQWIDRAMTVGRVAIDTETTSLNPMRADLVGISLSVDIGKAAYIPLAHVVERDLLGGGADDDIPQLPMEDVIAALKPLLEDPSVMKIGHNIKYDWVILAKHGIEMNPVDDTMLMSYALDGSSHGHGMDELAQLLCGHTTIKYGDVAGKGKNAVTFDKVAIDKALDYAAEDAEITLRLHHILKPRIVPEQCTRVYESIERPLIPVLAKMEMEGVKVDPAILKQMSHDFGHALVRLEGEIHTLAGRTFNVGSPKQLGVILFEEMGVPGGRKTKGGDWSTAVDVLEQLATEHEIVAKVLEWRQLAKLKSTYTDALQEQINPDTGRVHTCFQMAGTNTGRLASTDPNLQNIPIRTEEGRKIRTAFIAEPGWKILSVDYSQVELRLAAEMAGVDALRQAFRDKVDIHALTASQVFGVDLDKVTPELRRQAKAVNFGIIYGISGWGLAKQLGCDPGEANAFIRRYLARFSEIQNYMEARKDEARQNGFIRTLYGRKCYIANINSKIPAQKAGAERQAINAPLQGTAADIMKRAMIRMPHALANAGLRARMLIQVHDELVFEVPEDELEQTSTLVSSVMESAASLSLPLEAEAGAGDSWAAAH